MQAIMQALTAATVIARTHAYDNTETTCVLDLHIYIAGYTAIHEIKVKYN